ncbi:hypothetical protein HUN08_13680 [Gordonia sp. X0973]|uniref:lipase family protein n=1 Tax=Gordonia sp. X0973 TaxID=2742602 RepID=UPI000F52F5AA|nr:lipase family protein [Gordonia sp. X0973]QKT08120.1 hypothetical protein HUN08_13680 [Gordonia sp. X0973]
MASRTTQLWTAIAVVFASGALLLATAPPTNLVNAPINPNAGAQGGDFDTKVTPALASFYDTPLPPDAHVGQLFAAQPVEEAPADVKMFRILYVSTDLRGNKIGVSGLYVAPRDGAPAAGRPLVAFAHGTTGVGRMCGISHTPFTPSTPGFTAWGPHLKPLVDAGLAVVASDYSGMGAPGPSSYLVGPLEARGVLDSMRAVLNPSPMIGDIPIDKGKLAVYGKSQGGESATSTVEIAPTYAPDLRLSSGVILAPGYTPPIRGILSAVAKNPTSTDQNMFMLLIAKSYAENYSIGLDEILTPEGVKRAKLLENHCGSDLADRLSDIPLNQLLKTPVSKDLIAAMGRAMPGTKRLTAPIGVWQGLKDKTILPEVTHAQVMSQCALGTTTFYVRYPEDDHGSMNYQARMHQPSAIDYMKGIWAGNPAPNNCANQLLGTVRTNSKVK